jgi:hypothetical protein
MPIDHLDKNAKRRVIAESRKFYWDAPYLYRCGDDGVLRRCEPWEEREEILRKCHSSEYGGHYGHFRTQAKVWASGFYWTGMHEDAKRCCNLPRVPKEWKYIIKECNAAEL